MREGPLHAAVKALLAEPGDRLEVPVGRFVIDLVRADGELLPSAPLSETCCAPNVTTPALTVR